MNQRVSHIIKIERYEPYTYRVCDLNDKPCKPEWKDKYQITLNNNWLSSYNYMNSENKAEIYDHKWKRVFTVLGGWQREVYVKRRYGFPTPHWFDNKEKQTVLVMEAGFNPVGRYSSLPSHVIQQRINDKRLYNTLLNDNFFTDIKQVSWENVTTLM